MFPAGYCHPTLMIFFFLIFMIIFFIETNREGAKKSDGKKSGLVPVG